MTKHSRTAERRKEREQKKQRQRQLIVLGAVVVVALVAVVLVLVRNQPAEAPITAVSSARYADLRMSYTDDGFPRLGDPEASVRVVEISSFSCPDCASFHDEGVIPLLERVRAGDISFTYVPMFSIGGVPNGEGAARAALCAGQQNDENFWIMHDTLFEWQQTFGNQAFTTNRLSTGTENLNLNVDVFNQCFGSTEISQVVTEAEMTFAQLEERSAPAVLVNGVRVMATLAEVNAAIDQALALIRDRSDEPEVEETPEATAEPEVEETDEPAVEETPEATAEPEVEETDEPETEPEATAEAEPTTVPETEVTAEPEAEVTEEAG